MVIDKIALKKLASKQTIQPQKSHFRAMLDNHMHEKNLSKKADQIAFATPENQQNNNWDFNNISNLKDLDANYYDKGIKKKTLAQSYTKRYGTDPKERINKFKPLIELKAKKYNLDPNLLAGLVRQESNFNPYAVSHCGAMGLGQLMPETARHLGVVDPFNASQNLEGAAKYLRQLLDKFGGDVQKALAGYNAGPGAVMKHNGVPPYRETRNYVKAVQGHMSTIQNDKVFGSV